MGDESDHDISRPLQPCNTRHGARICLRGRLAELFSPHSEQMQIYPFLPGLPSRSSPEDAATMSTL